VRFQAEPRRGDRKRSCVSDGLRPPANCFRPFGSLFVTSPPSGGLRPRLIAFGPSGLNSTRLAPHTTPKLRLSVPPGRPPSAVFRRSVSRAEGPASLSPGRKPVLSRTFLWRKPGRLNPRGVSLRAQGEALWAEPWVCGHVARSPKGASWILRRASRPSPRRPVGAGGSWPSLPRARLAASPWAFLDAPKGLIHTAFRRFTQPANRFRPCGPECTGPKAGRHQSLTVVGEATSVLGATLKRSLGVQTTGHGVSIESVFPTITLCPARVGCTRSQPASWAGSVLKTNATPKPPV